RELAGAAPARARPIRHCLRASARRGSDMLISQNPRFLFVHIQKTGGTSLEKVLCAACPQVQQLGCRHDHASSACKILGPDYHDYFKFAFVRNPWDRLVSWYSMIVQYSQGKPRKKLNGLWQYVLDTASSF